MRRNLFARWRARSVFSAILAIALAAPTLAQTDVTTGRLSGTVRDANGGELPGVSVEGKNQDTGLTASAVTNKDGFYQLVNLPTGTYTITASLAGFRSATRPNIRLILGSSPTVDFTIELSNVAEAITVEADVPVVEVTNTAASTTIQAEELKALPLAGRDFKSLVLLTPSTRFDSERGNLSISGQRGINTNVTVDGVDFNNAFFGGTVGGAEGRAPLSISQESIKEFTVITNGASVEFGRSGGGFVNVITKSGTNKFHGSGFYYIQPQEIGNERIVANFANGALVSDQEKSQYGGSLGGPILKDRIFFFASYDNQDKSETVPITVGTGPTTGVIDQSVFDRYPALRTGPQYIQTTDGSVLFARMDFQPTSAHRFMLRGNFTEYEGVNGTSGSQNRTESFNGIEGLDTDAYVATYSGQFGTSLLNDLNLNYVKEDTPRKDKGLNLTEIQVAGLRYGEVGFLPITSTTKRKAVGDTVTFLAQSHVIKGGAEYNDTTIDQIFKGNWRGVFIFNNKADLIAGRWREYRQFGGLGGLTADEGGRANFGQKELAFFAQDQWFVSPKLTVTAGVRWERLDNPDDPILNQFDVNPNGSFKLNRQIPDAKNQWSPRLGIAWSPNQKTAVRLAAGRYWSRTPAILFAQLLTSNGVRATQYIIQAPIVGGNPQQPTDPLSPGWGGAFNPVGVQKIDFTRVPNPARPGVFAIGGDFDNPYTDRVTLGFERELFAKTSAALDLTYAKGEQLQRLKDINRVYDPAGVRAEPDSNAPPRYSSTQPNPFYGRITTSVSDAESEYYAVTLQLRRRFASSFTASVVTSWSEDKDNDSNERNFAGIQAEDYNNPGLNWGWSNRDQRWRGTASGVWDTPWWGIGLSGSFRYASGSPYNATLNFDLNNDGEGFTDRPTVNGVHFGRNSFRQPDFYSLDFRIAKTFKIGPGEVGLSADCFNCTNHGQRFVTNTTWGSEVRDGVRRSRLTPQAGFGEATGVGTQRFFQFAIRYDF